MKILGIDPALGSLGWGVIESNSSKINYVSSGLIKTSSSEAMHKRLWNIIGSIEQIMELHKPIAIAMEETFMNMNAVSSLKLAYVRGAIMALVGKHNINFYEYKPNSIKKTVVGVGHAEKEQVLHMIKLIICKIPATIKLDESDALAAAYTCLVYEKF